jgi:Na+-transporting NADH:ubiquinone oxidoreductase subunit A
MAAKKIYTIKRGLDLPIQGVPEKVIDDAPAASRVALMAADYIGLRPTMHVREGDNVQRGQLVLEDKKNPSLRLTAPAAGVVAAVNRGARRALQSVVIEVSEGERSGEVSRAPERSEDEAEFESYSGKDVAGMSRNDIKKLLLESGEWAALRTRPFSKTPAADTEPHSIFITAMDSNPLAPDVEQIIQERPEDFERGMLAVAKLTDGFTYLCTRPEADIPHNPNTGITRLGFEGPHPAGLAGLHIHLVDPVHREKTVWYIGFQDVIAIGHLVRTGRILPDRVVSLGGPPVKNPRMLRTRTGASLDEMLEGELPEDAPLRVVSGSVLAGRRAMGEVHGHIGRFSNQVSVVRENIDREFLGWMAPGREKFSTINLFLSRLAPKNDRYDMTTDRNGSKRAMVPIGMYERVMPMDLVATYLLRALIVTDTERAEQLGCLELDEEDLGLCTYVCPGKYAYGPLLRRNLEMIEKEG